METRTKFELIYEASTDVLHVVLPTREQGTVDVLDVGEDIGFPGQVLVRIDQDTGELLGMTILEYKLFRRRLMWRYRIASVNRALELVINLLKVNLRNRYRQPLYT